MSKLHAIDLESATVAFIEQFDRELGLHPSAAEVVARWRELTAHREGDRVSCHVGARLIEGSWQGIDDSGRALIRSGGESILSPRATSVPMG